MPARDFQAAARFDPARAPPILAARPQFLNCANMLTFAAAPEHPRHGLSSRRLLQLLDGPNQWVSGNLDPALPCALMSEISTIELAHIRISNVDMANWRETDMPR